MRYLALGDSYTIGEMVSHELNFPNQVKTLLEKKNIHTDITAIIATTGWTTADLNERICAEKPSFDHDWVTLLIGVNNQYQEKSLDEYAWQFYALVCQSILFARSNAERVIVLSIPDWGLTPFNETKNKEKISAEIDEFNKINKRITAELGCQYIDVTKLTRMHAQDKHYLASDLLHYSEHEYLLWAEKITDMIMS